MKKIIFNILGTLVALVMFGMIPVGLIIGVVADNGNSKLALTILLIYSAIGVTLITIFGKLPKDWS